MFGVKITLKELECLVKAAESGSFSQAADELNLAQPTLSDHIARLEKHLSSKLLKRGRNRNTLTNTGEIVYKYAVEIFNILEKTRTEIENLQGLKSGILKIEASTIPGTYILPEKIKKLKSLFPAIDLKLFINDSAVVIEDIQKGKIDIGLTGYPPPKQLYRQPVANDEIVVAVPSDHNWGRMNEIPLEELMEEALLVRNPGSGTQRFFLNTIRKKTSRKIKVFSTVGTSKAMKMSIIAGLAPGIISKIAIQKEVEQGTIKAINIKGVSLKRSFFLVLKNYDHASPACKEFIKLFGSK